MSLSAQNAARPPSGAHLAGIADVPDNSAVVRDFVVGEARWSVILVRVGAALSAFENVCPHAGFPLERPDGRVPMQEGRFLICTAHGASFDIATGVCAGGPAIGRALRRVEVRLEQGIIVMA